MTGDMSRKLNIGISNMYAIQVQVVSAVGRMANAGGDRRIICPCSVDRDPIEASVGGSGSVKPSASFV